MALQHVVTKTADPRCLEQLGKAFMVDEDRKQYARRTRSKEKGVEACDRDAPK